jgi:hypothetical protein
VSPDELAYLRDIVAAAWRVCAFGLSPEEVMARRETLKRTFLDAPDEVVEGLDRWMI